MASPEEEEEKRRRREQQAPPQTPERLPSAEPPPMDLGTPDPARQENPFEGRPQVASSEFRRSSAPAPQVESESRLNLPREQPAPPPAPAAAPDPEAYRTPRARQAQARGYVTTPPELMGDPNWRQRSGLVLPKGQRPPKPLTPEEAERKRRQAEEEARLAERREEREAQRAAIEAAGITRDQVTGWRRGENDELIPLRKPKTVGYRKAEDGRWQVGVLDETGERHWHDPIEAEAFHYDSQRNKVIYPEGDGSRTGPAVIIEPNLAYQQYREWQTARGEASDAKGSAWRTRMDAKRPVYPAKQAWEKAARDLNKYLEDGPYKGAPGATSPLAAVDPTAKSEAQVQEEYRKLVDELEADYRAKVEAFEAAEAEYQAKQAAYDELMGDPQRAADAIDHPRYASDPAVGDPADEDAPDERVVREGTGVGAQDASRREGADLILGAAKAGARAMSRLESLRRKRGPGAEDKPLTPGEIQQGLAVARGQARKEAARKARHPKNALFSRLGPERIGEAFAEGIERSLTHHAGQMGSAWGRVRSAMMEERREKLDRMVATASVGRAIEEGTRAYDERLRLLEAIAEKDDSPIFAGRRASEIAEQMRRRRPEFINTLDESAQWQDVELLRDDIEGLTPGDRIEAYATLATDPEQPKWVQLLGRSGLIAEWEREAWQAGQWIVEEARRRGVHPSEVSQTKIDDLPPAMRATNETLEEIQDWIERSEDVRWHYAPLTENASIAFRPLPGERGIEIKWPSGALETVPPEHTSSHERLLKWIAENRADRFPGGKGFIESRWDGVRRAALRSFQSLAMGVSRVGFGALSPRRLWVRNQDREDYIGYLRDRAEATRNAAMVGAGMAPISADGYDAIGYWQAMAIEEGMGAPMTLEEWKARPESWTSQANKAAVRPAGSHPIAAGDAFYNAIGSLRDQIEPDPRAEVLAASDSWQRYSQMWDQGMGDMGSQAVTSLAGAATGIPGAGAVTSLAGNFARMFDEAVNDALASGATPEEALGAAVRYAPIAAGLEYLPFHLLGRKTQAMLSKAFQELAPARFKAWMAQASPLVSGLISGAGRVGGEMAVGGAAEGLTEGAQQVTLNAVAREFYDQNRDLFEGWGEAVAVGFLVGATMGAAGGAPAGVADVVKGAYDQLVKVRPATSNPRVLEELNRQRQQEGRPPVDGVQLVDAARALRTELDAAGPQLLGEQRQTAADAVVREVGLDEDTLTHVAGALDEGGLPFYGTVAAGRLARQVVLSPEQQQAAADTANALGLDETQTELLVDLVAGAEALQQAAAGVASQEVMGALEPTGMFEVAADADVAQVRANPDIATVFPEEQRERVRQGLRAFEAQVSFVPGPPDVAARLSESGMALVRGYADDLIRRRDATYVPERSAPAVYGPYQVRLAVGQPAPAAPDQAGAPEGTAPAAPQELTFDLNARSREHAVMLAVAEAEAQGHEGGIEVLDAQPLGVAPEAGVPLQGQQLDEATRWRQALPQRQPTQEIPGEAADTSNVSEAPPATQEDASQPPQDQGAPPTSSQGDRSRRAQKLRQKRRAAEVRSPEWQRNTAARALSKWSRPLSRLGIVVDIKDAPLSDGGAGAFAATVDSQNRIVIEVSLPGLAEEIDHFVRRNPDRVSRHSVRAWISRAIAEEIEHAAGFAVMRREWIAAGRPGFLANYAADRWGQMAEGVPQEVVNEVKRAREEGVDKATGRLNWVGVAELVRMMGQASQGQGSTITERMLHFLTDKGRDLVDHLRRTARLLANWVRQADEGGTSHEVIEFVRSVQDILRAAGEDPDWTPFSDVFPDARPYGQTTKAWQEAAEVVRDLTDSAAFRSLIQDPVRTPNRRLDTIVAQLVEAPLQQGDPRLKIAADELFSRLIRDEQDAALAEAQDSTKEFGANTSDLVSVIIRKGGIRPVAEGEPMRGEYQALREEPGLRRPGIWRRAGLPADKMAAELQAEGFEVSTADEMFELMRRQAREGPQLPTKDPTWQDQQQQPLRAKTAVTNPDAPVADDRRFRSWFRDSVVAWADGLPRRVYHGTRQAFASFDLGKVRPDAFGFHFGTLGQAADRFMVQPKPDAFGQRPTSDGRQIYPVYLSIQNPVQVEDQMTWDPYQLAGELTMQGILAPEDTGMAPDDMGRYQVVADSPFVALDDWEAREVLIAMLDAVGVDGIVYINRFEGHEQLADRIVELHGVDPTLALNEVREKMMDAEDEIREWAWQRGIEEDIWSWMVWRPEQVKSVFNRGEWSPSDGDLLRAKTGVTHPTVLANAHEAHRAAAQAAAELVARSHDPAYLEVHGFDRAGALREELRRVTGWARRAARFPEGDPEFGAKLRDEEARLEQIELDRGERDVAEPPAAPDPKLDRVREQVARLEAKPTLSKGQQAMLAKLRARLPATEEEESPIEVDDTGNVRLGRLQVSPNSAVLFAANGAVSTAGLQRIEAHHGTRGPLEGDRFSLRFVGSGEGAQVYGWGLYFAEMREVAEQYARTFGEAVYTIAGERIPGAPIEGDPAAGWAARFQPTSLSEEQLNLVMREAREAVEEVARGPIGPPPTDQNWWMLAIGNAISWIQSDVEAALDPGAAGPAQRKRERDEDVANARDVLSNTLTWDWRRAGGVIYGRLRDVIEASREEHLYTVALEAADHELLPYEEEVRPGVLWAIVDAMGLPTNEAELRAEWDAHLEDMNNAMTDEGARQRVLAMSDSGRSQRLETAAEIMFWQPVSGRYVYDTIVTHLAPRLIREMVSRDMEIGDQLPFYREPEMASRFLRDVGLVGIKYLDGFSRATGEGTYNYVIWDEDRIRVTHYNGEPVQVEQVSLFAKRPAAAEDSRDAEYLAAVSRGDMDAAQAMVDAAAREAGYTVGPVWHGTPDGRFLGDGVFKSQQERFGFGEEVGVHWFARSRAAAATYADDRRALDYQNAEPRMVKAFLKLENPLEIDGRGQPWRDAQARGKARTVVDEAIESGADGVVINSVIDDYNTMPGQRGTGVTDTFAVFSSNQIKSADPVTYDERGEVIPLSERFDTGSPSILRAKRARARNGRYPVPPAPTGVAKPSDAMDHERIGTAKVGTKAKPEPTTPETNISWERVPPLVRKQQMAQINRKSYPHLPDEILDEPDYEKKRRKFIEWQKANLKALFKAFPKRWRQRTTHWYDGAHRIALHMAHAYDTTARQAAGVLAALSPQKDWFQNVAMAEQVLAIRDLHWDRALDETLVRQAVEDIVAAAQATPKQLRKKPKGRPESKLARTRRLAFNRRQHEKVREQRREILEQLVGRRLSDFDPTVKEQAILQAWGVRVLAQALYGQDYRIIVPEGEPDGWATKKDGSRQKLTWQGGETIAKALAVLRDGSLENISEQLGNEHKVRSFYNNIIAPNSPHGDGTIDTHAVAAANLMPYGALAMPVKQNLGAGRGSGKAGVSGLYHLQLDALREAAADLKLQPRQLQSITWEAIRAVFPSEDRRDSKVVAAAREAWQNLGGDGARQQIVGAGVPAPGWVGARLSRQLGGSPARIRETARAESDAAGGLAFGGRRGDAGRPALLRAARASFPVDSPAFRRWFGDSKVVDDEGRPLVVYHGSTHSFDAFEPGRANLENFLGAGFYFSSDPADVARNYAGEGPDLTNRIETLAERLQSEEELDEQEATRRARAMLSGGAPQTYPVVLAIENPVVLDGLEGTHLDVEQPFEEDEDGEIIDYGEPQGPLVDFIEGYRRAAWDLLPAEWDMGDIDDALNELLMEGVENEGLAADQVVHRLQQDHRLFDMYSDAGDSLISHELIRRAFEHAGFDGVIDHRPSQRFNMEGLDEDTKHFVAFHDWQIKSALGNAGTYERGDPSMLRAKPAPPVNSEAFRRWFKGSKAVDENGEPLVVYRGMRKWPREDSMATKKATLSFAAIPEIANLYAHTPEFFGIQLKRAANVGAYFLALKKPFDMRDLGTRGSLWDAIAETNWSWMSEDAMDHSKFTFDDVLSLVHELKWNEKMGGESSDANPDFSTAGSGMFVLRDWEEFGEELEKAYEIKDEDERAAAIEDLLVGVEVDFYGVADTEAFTDSLERLGYDGIIHLDTVEGGIGYFPRPEVAGRPVAEVEGIDVDEDFAHVTFRPFKIEQVKSAIGNRGTYDPSEKSVLRAKPAWDVGRPDYVTGVREPVGGRFPRPEGEGLYSEYARQRLERFRNVGAPLTPIGAIKPGDVIVQNGRLIEVAKVERDERGFPRGWIITDNLGQSYPHQVEAAWLPRVSRRGERMTQEQLDRITAAFSAGGAFTNEMGYSLYAKSGVGADEQRRARPGGELGPNGEWYPGGAFIATTEMPKLMRRQFKKAAERKEVLYQEDGWKSVWGVPEPGQMPIARWMGTLLDGQSGTFMEEFAKRQGYSEEEIESFRPIAEAAQRGARFVSVNAFPEWATPADAARLLDAGEAVPGALMDKVRRLNPKAAERLERFQAAAAPPPRGFDESGQGMLLAKGGADEGRGTPEMGAPLGPSRRKFRQRPGREPVGGADRGAATPKMLPPPPPDPSYPNPREPRPDLDVDGVAREEDRIAQAREDQRAAEEDLPKFRKELAKRRRKLKVGGYTLLMRGKYDVLDVIGKGAGRYLRAYQTEMASARRAVEEMLGGLRQEMDAALGEKWWERVFGRGRRKEFERDLLHTAARLNPVARDDTGSGYVYEGFEMRVGYMTAEEMERRGLRPGMLLRLPDGTRARIQMEYRPEIEGHLLVIRITAAAQAAIYRNFANRWPEMIPFLDRWIEPGQEGARMQTPNGYLMPTFNRHSLAGYYSESPYGDVGFVSGYTPDVLLDRHLVGSLVRVVKELQQRAESQTRLSGSLLTGKQSPARKLKTGAAREMGAVKPMLNGFGTRVLEAHLERRRRELALGLLERLLQPVPSDVEAIPQEWEHVGKPTLNRILRGLLQALGAHSREGRSLNKLWRELVERYEEAVDKNQPMPADLLFDETTANYSDRERELLDALFGDGEKVAKMLVTPQMIHRRGLREIMATHSDYEWKWWLTSFIANCVQEYTAGNLTRPGTLLVNWLSPNLQAGIMAANRAMRAGINLASAVAPWWDSKEALRDAEIDARTAAHVLGGLVLRRFPDFQGIRFYLPRNAAGVPDPQAPPANTMQAITAWVARATDQRSRIGAVVPPEWFADSGVAELTMGAIEDVEAKNLFLNLQPGSGLLKLSRFSGYDVAAKQNMHLAGVLAVAGYEARRRKLKGKERAEFIRRYAQEMPQQRPEVHREAFAAAQLFGLDYGNVPFWLEPQGPYAKFWRAGLQLMTPYAKFPYTMARFTKRTLGQAPVDLVRPSSSRRQRAEAAANLATWGMMAFGVTGLRFSGVIADWIVRGGLLYAIGMWIKAMTVGLDDDEWPDEYAMRGTQGRLGTDFDVIGEDMTLDKDRAWLTTGGKVDVTGTPLGSFLTGMSAYMGEEVGEDKELWLRTRSFPYVNIVLGIESMWQLGPMGGWKNDQERSEAVRNVTTALGEHATVGALLGIGVENRYNAHLDPAQRATKLGVDALSSRLVPLPWRRDLAQWLDPVSRRRRDNKSLDYEHGLLGEVLRETPWLTRMLPPSGDVREVYLDSEQPGYEQRVENARAAIDELERAGFPEHLVSRTYVNEKGRLTLAFVDPLTVRERTRAELMLSGVFRTNTLPALERELAVHGLTLEEANRLEKKRALIDGLLERGEPVPEAADFTVWEETKYNAWQMVKKGEDYKRYIEGRILNDKVSTVEKIHSITTRVAEGGSYDWRVHYPKWFMEALIERQPRNAAGEMIDPFTGEVLTPGNFDVSHKPGRPWRKVKDEQPRTMTREEFVEQELVPEHYILMTPSANRSGKFETVPRKPYRKPVVNQ